MRDSAGQLQTLFDQTSLYVPDGCPVYGFSFLALLRVRFRPFPFAHAFSSFPSPVSCASSRTSLLLLVSCVSRVRFRMFPCRPFLAPLRVRFRPFPSTVSCAFSRARFPLPSLAPLRVRPSVSSALLLTYVVRVSPALFTCLLCLLVFSRTLMAPSSYFLVLFTYAFLLSSACLWCFFGVTCSREKMSLFLCLGSC